MVRATVTWVTPSERAGEIGNARLPGYGDQFSDQFHIILRSFVRMLLTGTLRTCAKRRGARRASFGWPGDRAVHAASEKEDRHVDH
jgi:hypothetical protein